MTFVSKAATVAQEFRRGGNAAFLVKLSQTKSFLFSLTAVSGFWAQHSHVKADISGYLCVRGEWKVPGVCSFRVKSADQGLNFSPITF